MKMFVIALAAFVSLGLAVPAFAHEKKETMPAAHHHHHHHHQSPSHDEARSEIIAAIGRTAGLVWAVRGERASPARFPTAVDHG